MTQIHIHTADSPGLLADIAKTFIECRIRLLSAKISTAGEKAMDYFDVTSMDNNLALSDDAKENIKTSLIKILQ